MLSGIYGNNPEDRAREAELNRYLDKTYCEPSKREEEIEDRVNDKFMALPELYTCRDGTRRWSNMEDAVDGFKQAEWIAIARALRDGEYLTAGLLLDNSLVRVLTQQVEDEMDDREA